MLSHDVNRYIELRQSLGFKFCVPAILLRGFASFAEQRGACYVRSQPVLNWAAGAPYAAQRRERLIVVGRFSHYMQTQDERYEVPSALAFGKPLRTPRMPHIFTSEEINRLLKAAERLTPVGSTRPTTYVTLLSLLVCTGLRISEAIALQFVAS